jgi:hypothetical protein
MFYNEYLKKIHTLFFFFLLYNTYYNNIIEILWVYTIVYYKEIILFIARNIHESVKFNKLQFGD